MKLFPSIVLLALVALNADAQWSQIGAESETHRQRSGGGAAAAASFLRHHLRPVRRGTSRRSRTAISSSTTRSRWSTATTSSWSSSPASTRRTNIGRRRAGASTVCAGRTARSSIDGPRRATGSRCRDFGPAAWEPVFHAVLANGFVYMPAAGGTLLQLDRNDGHVIKRINPFATVDPNVYVSGVPAADAAGNIYYGAFALDAAALWAKDITGAWLVRVKPDGSATSVPFASLVPNAPSATDQCTTAFRADAAAALASDADRRRADGSLRRDASGHQRGAGHRRRRHDLRRRPCELQWRLRLRRRRQSRPDAEVEHVDAQHLQRWLRRPRAVRNQLRILPRRRDARRRSERRTSRDRAASLDDSTSSPVVLPDGSVLYGSYTGYNGARGHLIRFSSAGAILANYDFGWDTTPAVWEHGGTYSIVMKENFYAQQAYYITQLDPNLKKEWQFKSTETQACGRGPDGNVTCVDETAVRLRMVRELAGHRHPRHGLREQRRRQPLRDRARRRPRGQDLPPTRPRRRLHAGLDRCRRTLVRAERGTPFAVGGSRPRHRAVRR